jgi:hypothetical protein
MLAYSSQNPRRVSLACPTGGDPFGLISERVLALAGILLSSASMFLLPGNDREALGSRVRSRTLNLPASPIIARHLPGLQASAAGQRAQP